MLQHSPETPRAASKIDSHQMSAAAGAAGGADGTGGELGDAKGGGCTVSSNEALSLASTVGTHRIDNSGHAKASRGRMAPRATLLTKLAHTLF